MERPKNFLFAVVLLSVVAIALAAAVYTLRERQSSSRPAPAPAAAGGPLSPVPASETPAPKGTPSAAAQRRAQEFNDAANRFNAPDDQQH